MSEIKHVTGWTFEVPSRTDKDKTYLVQLDADDPQDVCDCVYSYCQVAAKMKAGVPFSSKSCCPHVRAVAMWLFDNNILTEARK